MKRWSPDPLIGHVRRLDGICRAVGTALADDDVQVITAPSVRLDLEQDRKALGETVA